jgi:hypothetical protein
VEVARSQRLKLPPRESGDLVVLARALLNRVRPSSQRQQDRAGDDKGTCVPKNGVWHLTIHLLGVKTADISISASMFERAAQSAEDTNCLRQCHIGKTARDGVRSTVRPTRVD